MKNTANMSYSLESQPIVQNTLIVNRSQILELTFKLKAADSLTTLRGQIFEFKKQLNTYLANSNNLPNNSEHLVEFRSNYLLEELRQIEESLTLERAKYYAQRFERGVLETKTSRINDINLNRWKEYSDIETDSLWLLDRRDGSGAHRADYWGNFVPQIPHQMMKRFTKRGEWVLDTFAGSGTTLIESQRLGRNGIGIELQADVAARARQAIWTEPNRDQVVNQIVQGDSTTVDYAPILAEHQQKSAQLVIMHPPYFDIIKFSDDPRDLSNAPSVDSFLKMIKKVASQALAVLDKNRYLVLVMGDKYAKGEWIPLGFLSMNVLLELGLKLKSTIVKNFEETTGKRNQKELWRYRALSGGFYIFKHEYIFVFEKVTSRQTTRSTSSR